MSPIFVSVPGANAVFDLALQTRLARFSPSRAEDDKARPTETAATRS